MARDAQQAGCSIIACMVNWSREAKKNALLESEHFSHLETPTPVRLALLDSSTTLATATLLTRTETALKSLAIQSKAKLRANETLGLSWGG